MERKEKEFRGPTPIMLTDEKLRELANQLGEFCTEIEYSIETTETKEDDKENIRFQSVEDLLAFDNAKRNRILRLFITCSGEEPEKLLLIFNRSAKVSCEYSLNETEEQRFLWMLYEFLNPAQAKKSGFFKKTDLDRHAIRNSLINVGIILALNFLIPHNLTGIKRTILIWGFIVTSLAFISSTTGLAMLFKFVVFYWGGGIRAYERLSWLRKEKAWYFALRASIAALVCLVIVLILM